MSVSVVLEHIHFIENYLLTLLLQTDIKQYGNTISGNPKILCPLISRMNH